MTTRDQEINRAAVEALHGDPRHMDSQEMCFTLGAHWADAHPHWISVEDELPSLYDDYLVCTSGNIIEISHFNIDGWHNESAGKVTHWMALPNPPVLSTLEKTAKNWKENNHIIGGEEHIKTALDTLAEITKGGEK